MQQFKRRLKWIEATAIDQLLSKKVQEISIYYLTDVYIGFQAHNADT